MKFLSQIIIILVAVALIGCEKKNEKLTLNFTDEVIADSVVLGNPDGKAVIKVCYQKVASNEAVKFDEMNQKIDDYVASVLAQYSTEPVDSSDIDRILDEFLLSYEDFHDDFPDAPQEWTVNSKGKISVYKNYISQRFNSYYFAGGAHPNSFTSFLNLNVLTGKEIGLLDIIKEEKISELTVLCEKIFRKDKKLSPQESLTEAGFWFDNDKFFLSDNFGFNSTSLIFYYNPYEIAPYVAGATEIQVNFTEIPLLLK